MKKTFFLALTGLFSVLMVTSCDDDSTPTNNDFTVTIENVIEGKEFFDNGTTGLILPGNSASFSFDAGKGHYLSFATMFVQSNDLFFAPQDNGLALYNDDGSPITGDVTNQILLWDAGTEVNEEPGVGSNQAPRQSAANTGATENGVVRLISDVNDGFTYPSVASVINVSLTHDGGTHFTVEIENVSNNSALPSPLAPGAWVINSADQKPLFTEGSAASAGLEDIAEDGNTDVTNNDISGRTGYVSPFAPGAFAINDALFTTGQTSSAALEALAEDGNASGFSNVFNQPEGSSSAGPLLPGNAYSFTFSATEGDKLSFATMLVQTNDWFVGVENLDIYNNGTPLSGDITQFISLFDAGTEVDEYPGAGNNQPLRQAAANTGAGENGNVVVETNPQNVPQVSDLVKVTITRN